MNATEIYSILRAGGMTRAGALGMLGNMMAESSMIPNIAQRGMTNLSDAEYTRQADEGLLDFTKPVGYGLCQWTLPSRKRALLSYAKEMHCSVGDGAMQTYFCIRELKEDFPDVWRLLTTSDDIDACADIICTKFERPAVNNLEQRRRYAHTFEADIPEDQPNVPQEEQRRVNNINASILGLQAIMLDNCYPVGKLGEYNREMSERLHEFVDDLDKVYLG